MPVMFGHRPEDEDGDNDDDRIERGREGAGRHQVGCGDDDAHHPQRDQHGRDRLLYTRSAPVGDLCAHQAPAALQQPFQEALSLPEGNDLAESLDAVHHLRVQRTQGLSQSAALGRRPLAQPEGNGRHCQGRGEQRQGEQPVHRREGEERPQRHHDRHDESPNRVSVEPLDGVHVGHRRGGEVAGAPVEKIARRQPVQRLIEPDAELGQDAVREVVRQPHLRPGRHRPAGHDDAEREGAEVERFSRRPRRHSSHHERANAGGGDHEALVQDAREHGDPHEPVVRAQDAEQLPEPSPPSAAAWSELPFPWDDRSPRVLTWPPAAPGRGRHTLRDAPSIPGGAQPRPPVPRPGPRCGRRGRRRKSGGRW